MFYWIQGNQIAAIGNSDQIVMPDSYTCLEGPDGSLQDVYYDGTAVLLKPERPSDTAIWDDASHSWVEPPPPPEPAPVPNWAALGDALVADLDILNKLAANPLFPALVGRLQTLRQGGATGNPEPLIALWNNHSYSLSEAECQWFNDLATQHHIPLQLEPNGTLAVATP